MAEIPQVQETIPRRKVIVYKSRVDPTIIKLTAEKIKSRLFVKFGFSKPRPEEIKVVLIDKYYEPYILVDAKYSVDYFKRKAYTLDVHHEAKEVRILGNALKPETEVAENGQTQKSIRFEVDELFTYEDRAYVAIDKMGSEIPPELVPSAPSEDHPGKILKEAGKKAGKIRISPRRAIELVKSRIVKRPSDADGVENEVFEVFESALIYSPIYEMKFRNLKTGEEKIIKVDGVSAKIFY